MIRQLSIDEVRQFNREIEGKKYPVQVTRWCESRDDISFCVTDLKRQGVRFGVAIRPSQGYSVWREALPKDSIELLQGEYPAIFVED